MQYVLYICVVCATNICSTIIKSRNLFFCLFDFFLHLLSIWKCVGVSSVRFAVIDSSKNIIKYKLNVCDVCTIFYKHIRHGLLFSPQGNSAGTLSNNHTCLVNQTNKIWYYVFSQVSLLHIVAIPENTVEVWATRKVTFNAYLFYYTAQTLVRLFFLILNKHFPSLIIRMISLNNPAF